ncbi:MAG: hypothetical protein AAF730_01290 [Bacteroidota bacterium]
MFFSLLLVTFAVSATVAIGVALAFKKPIAAILNRIIADQIAGAWERYLMFALFVVGISGGVRIYQLERYITAGAHSDAVPIVLNSERWTLEVYRTIIETLQAIAWMLLVFFVVALIAYVIVRASELKHQRKAHADNDADAS